MGTKKKILFLIPMPPPVHGVTSINLQIKKSRKLKKKFETYFLNSSQAINLVELEIFKIRKLLKFIYFYFELLTKILNIKPDVIYFNLSPRGLGYYRDILYVILLKLLKQKVIFHLHGIGFLKKTKNSLIQKNILFFLFKNINLICLSKLSIRDIELVRDKNKKIFILNNFSNPNLFKSKVKRPFTFVYLSNLVPSKGINIFLDSIELLNKKNLIFKAKIIGKSSDNKFLNKIKKRINKIDNVKYMGPLYGKKKFLELSKSDVFVLPTSYTNENFPVSILESMSSSVPVIAPKIGGIPNIVDHNKNGFLIGTNISKNYSKYMEIYIRKKKIHKKHKINAKKKWQKNFSFQIFENKLIKIFERVILKN